MPDLHHGCYDGGMLTLHVVKDEEYWLRQVAGIRAERGADGAIRYYSEAGEAPGVFCGRGARALGLVGKRVSPEENAEAYRRLMAGQDPETGRQLVKGPAKGERVKGWDALMSAPKSVTLLWAFGGAEVRKAIEAAHAEACRRAFEHFDDMVAYGRRGHAGETQIATDGLIATGFQHRCSRCGDPSLHTHHVIANMVKGLDGGWSALDARVAHAYAKESGYLYQAELRAQVLARLAALGIHAGWGPVVKGQAEVLGMSRELAKLFSKRHDEIAEDLVARGVEPTAAAQELAKRRTRPQKESGKTTSDLVEGWVAEAQAAGYDVDTAALLRAIDGHGGRPRPAQMTTSLARRLAAALTSEANTFGLRDVVMAVASDFQAGIPVEDAVRLAGEFLATKEVIGLGRAAELRTGDVITLANGRSIPVPGVGQAVWSTPGVVARERGLVAWAVARKEAIVGMARAAEVVKAMDAYNAAHPTRQLTTEQKVMIHGLCEDGQGVSVVRGPAGAGKTTALRAATQAWQASGHEVLGMAAVTRNAEAMDKLGIQTTNIDAILTLLEGREHSITGAAGKPWVQIGFRPHTVVIVDEAERMRLDHWTRLVHQIELSYDCKLVVLGDEAQKGAIGLQGPFRQLAEQLDAYRLTENRRQKEAWERTAIAALREATTGEEAAAALKEYEHHGRVHYATGSSPRQRQALREQMMTDALEARAEARVRGEDILILTDTRAERDRLNRIARGRLIEQGDIKVAQAQGYSGLEVAPGDEIQTQRQATRYGITNGWVLRVIQCDKNSVTAERIDPGPHAGDRVVIPAWYFGRHEGVRGVEYGHARTVSKEQGATASSVFVLSDPNAIDHEGIYTGLSRGEGGNHLYFFGQPDDMVDYDIPQPVGDAATQAEKVRESLLRGMIRSRTTKLALEVEDELERGDVAAATATVLAEAEATVSRAGVPFTPDTVAEVPKVPADAAGLDGFEAEASLRTHSGEPLPAPDLEATSAAVARAEAKDQAAALAAKRGRELAQEQERWRQAAQQRGEQERQGHGLKP